MITFILSLTAIFSTALGPILAANTVTLSLWFVVDFTKIALLTGYFLLGAGVASILFVPSSRIWGKRHTFIIGTIITIGSSAWAGAVDRNYSSFLWSRIIQGVGCAPFEALVNAAVGDLYFVHVSCFRTGSLSSRLTIGRNSNVESEWPLPIWPSLAVPSSRQF
jgi:MFS family permease